MSEADTQTKPRRGKREMKAVDREDVALKEKLEAVMDILHKRAAGFEGDMDNSASLDSLVEASIKEKRTTEAKLQFLMTTVQDSVDSQIAKLQRQMNLEIDNLRSVVGALFDEVENVAVASSSESASAETRKKKGGRKLFEARESLLYRMLAIDHYQTIFNIAIAVLIMFGLNVAINDYYETGTIFVAELLTWAFQGISIALRSWILFFVCSFSIIPLAYVTAISSGAVRLVLLSTYVLLQTLYYTYAYIVLYDSGVAAVVKPAAAALILCEQTRMSMKMHAYFREKLCWKDGNAFKPLYPPTRSYWEQEASSFFYFMWIPTLVYRTNYPQTRRVRWDFVFRRLLEVLGIIYYFFVIFRMALPNIQKADQSTPWTLKEFIVAVFRSMLPGMMTMLTGFFMVLHSIQNLGAEVTGFADRQFYEDWWNARDWATFYRKWNGVVHDWIHSYLYLDLNELAGFSRPAAKLAAFGISAVIHEYIIACALGYFYPVLLLMFGGPGVLFTFLTGKKKDRFWNIFMWLMLALGNGLLLVLYSMEYYARSFHQDQVYIGALAYIPRSWIPFLLGTGVGR